MRGVEINSTVCISGEDGSLVKVHPNLDRTAAAMFVFNGNEATSGAWVFMDKPDIDRLIEGLQQAREQLL